MVLRYHQMYMYVQQVPLVLMVAQAQPAGAARHQMHATIRVQTDIADVAELLATGMLQINHAKQ